MAATHLYVLSTRSLLCGCPTYGQDRFASSIWSPRTALRARRGRGRLHISVAAQDGSDDGVGGGSREKDVRQLWRTELTEFDDEGSAALEGDIERQGRREELERRLRQRGPTSDDEEAKKGKGVAVRALADRLLVADFFFVLLSLAWLVVALAERAALGSSGLIDSWLPLWPSLFQPALGFLMAGAILSVVTKKK